MSRYPQTVVDAKIAEITHAYESGQIGEQDFYLIVYPWAAGLFKIVEPEYDPNEDEEIEALLAARAGAAS